MATFFNAVQSQTTAVRNPDNFGVHVIFNGYYAMAESLLFQPEVGRCEEAIVCESTNICAPTFDEEVSVWQGKQRFEKRGARLEESTGSV
jgi:hypothetical protein